MFPRVEWMPTETSSGRRTSPCSNRCSPRAWSIGVIQPRQKRHRGCDTRETPTVVVLMRRLARAAGLLLAGAGALTLIWAVVVWQWQDPFTALYTTWQQH